LNSLVRSYNDKSTELRKEYERIGKEIEMNFKHKMFLLRTHMQNERKDKIAKI